MNNIELFICTHRDFIYYPTNKAYKIVCEEGDLIEPYPLDIIYEKHTKYTPLQKSLCEVSRIYWIWKSYTENNFMGFYSSQQYYDDYIGICHYSRYFKEFFDDVSGIPSKLNSQPGLSVLTLRDYKWNMRKQYDFCHFVDDYDIMTNIICKKLNLKDIHKYEEYFYPCNMFIMKRTHFNRYCEFLFYVLDEFIRIKHFKTMDDIDFYVEREIKLKHEREEPDEELTEEDLKESIKIQRRLLGFLAERISSFWFQYSFNNIITLDLKDCTD